ncbi:MAG: cyclic nucleotide-binding domain-containing protein [Verrucomicrobiaceae bacterium]|uniref:cyclic nucleotide-binding domain-containing protein n=1 Tax=Aestuariivirga sp. TaxID=2650926 RepID=UPI0030168E1D
MQQLRQAESADEKQSIYQFRYRVFSQHLGRDDLDGLDHERRVLSEALDNISTHFYFGEFGRPVAAVTLSPIDDAHLSADLSQFLAINRLRKAVDIQRMRLVNWLLVDPDYSGSSLVPMLLSSCYELLLGSDVDLLLTFCRPGLVAFYERFGLEQYSYATQLKGIGLRCPLMLMMKDASRLRAVRSPLLRIMLRSGCEDRSDDTRLRLEPIVDLFQASQILVNDELWIETGHKFVERPVPKLFDEIGEDSIRHVMKLASVISCESGELITREGETSDDMYLIVSGSFEAGKQGARQFRPLGPGDLFGEIEHLSRVPRSETVRSTTLGHIAALKSERLFQWMEKDPEPGVRMALNLAKLLAGRIA